MGKCLFQCLRICHDGGGKVGQIPFSEERKRKPTQYLGYLDVLVDGPFVEAKKDLALRFRGSSNQRLIDVPKTLKEGKIVLWEDWQGDLKGMK